MSSTGTEAARVGGSQLKASPTRGDFTAGFSSEGGQGVQDQPNPLQLSILPLLLLILDAKKHFGDYVLA